MGELLATGAKLLLQRGGYKLAVEVASCQQDDGTLHLTLSACDFAPDASVWEIENQALMPLLIFGSGHKARELAERKVREFLIAPQSQTWEESAEQATWTT